MNAFEKIGPFSAYTLKELFRFMRNHDGFAYTYLTATPDQWGKTLVGDITNAKHDRRTSEYFDEVNHICDNELLNAAKFIAAYKVHSYGSIRSLANKAYEKKNYEQFSMLFNLLSEKDSKFFIDKMKKEKTMLEYFNEVNFEQGEDAPEINYRYNSNRNGYIIDVGYLTSHIPYSTNWGWVMFKINQDIVKEIMNGNTIPFIENLFSKCTLDEICVWEPKRIRNYFMKEICSFLQKYIGLDIPVIPEYPEYR